MLALVGDVAGVGEVLRHERDAERVAGQERDRADLARGDVDVELANALAGATLVDDAHADSDRGRSEVDGAILAARHRLAERAAT